MEKVLPHADFLLTSEGIEPEQAIYIASFTGRHHSDLGRYRLGEMYRRKALALSEKNYKPGDPVIAVQQSNLALALKDLGELEEAKELFTLAYHSLLEKLGPDHPSTKIVKGNLESLSG